MATDQHRTWYTAFCTQHVGRYDTAHEKSSCFHALALHRLLQYGYRYQLNSILQMRTNLLYWIGRVLWRPSKLNLEYTVLPETDVLPGPVWRSSPRCVSPGCVREPSPWTGSVLTGLPRLVRCTPNRPVVRWSSGRCSRSQVARRQGNLQTSL